MSGYRWLFHVANNFRMSSYTRPLLLNWVFFLPPDDWNEMMFDAETGQLEGRTSQVVMMRRQPGQRGRKASWKLKKRQDGATQAPQQSQRITSGTWFLPPPRPPLPPQTVSAQAGC